MAMSGGKDDGSPMMEMNTTPLIDVMLVLLIMFIITIPVQTHAIAIDLPAGDPPPTDIKIDPIKNKVVIGADGVIQWNGTAVNKGQLAELLEQTKAFAVEPELQFQPDARARYEVVNSALNVIKVSAITKFGFVGNEQFGAFLKGPAPASK